MDDTSIKRATEEESEEEEGTSQGHCVMVDQLRTPEAEKRKPRNDDEESTKERETEAMMASKEESQPTPESLVRIKIHNDTSERLNDVTLKWFSNLNSGFSVHESTKDKPSITYVVPLELYTLKFDKVSTQIDEVNDMLENLQRNWSAFVSASDCRHLWLEIERPTISPEALSSPKHKLQVLSMSIGSFPSYGKYCCHWSSGPPCPELEVTVCFEYDLEIATIQLVDRRRGKWKLETAFDHLDKFILVTTTQTGYHVYLFQKNTCKIFLATKSRPFSTASPSDVIDSEKAADKEIPQWRREILYGDCPTKILGSSNVIQLQLERNGSRLNDMLSRFAELDFCIVAGNPKWEDVLIREPIPYPEFKSFRLTYAWYCLMSKGFKVTDQVTQELITTINEAQKEPGFEETVRAVASVIDKTSICNLEKQFQKELERTMSRKQSDEFQTENDEPSVPHVIAIRRLILTPTTIKGLGEEWTVENRVLREFGSDRFVRVSIRDDDFSRLTSYIPIQEIKKRIIDFLTNGFVIGDREYRFLGCSNSQLRSHSVWMYASDGQGHTVDSIRQWMGDVSHERCVATYVSRLGQCFTSTRNTVEVKNVERNVKDITRNTKYRFTDGIGRISAPLARRVAKSLNLRYTPSAFQIRFGGCKGVVALAPDLGEEEKLQLRKSMEKFPSDHNQLEVVEKTRPTRLSLNRQAILLLSGLGVPDEAFFKLQDKMLINMADILFDEDIAVKVIAQTHLGIERKKLKESGIVVTTEPFLREILATIYRQRFNNLLTRTHIEIPEDKGRIMIGTVDEFDCLEYGEVFVQFSKDPNNPKQDLEVLNRSVVVTKNPCFHPGDMRKFKAVDKLKLYDMVDCIVFPAKGPRPHPNEMSGSDLDGDMYFVCWEESLIPPEENRKAMDFTPLEKQVLPEKVTEADMIQFIGDYIDSDQLGIIANAHLVHADSKGVNCRECIEIAHTHSNAVDFPKTGQVQKLPQNLRPASYPDYMMKTDKPSYISTTVIGKLFQQCRTVELSNEFRKLESIVPDPDLILQGHENYLEGARLMKATYLKKMDELMAMYEISTEVELLSVGTLGMQKRLGHLKGDQYAVAEIIKLRLEAIKENMKTMFYKEFGGVKRQHDPALVCQKVSALYKVSHDALEQNQGTKDENDKNSETKVTEQSQSEPDRQCLGLPWIFGDLLCMVKKQHSPTLKHDTEKLKLIRKSFLHKISLEIASIQMTRPDEDWTKLCRELLCKLVGFDSSKEDGMKLIPFGSIITDCASNAPSLDIFVDIDSLNHPANQFEEKSERFMRIATILADQVNGELFRGVRSKPSSKLRIVCIPDTTMNITLFSDGNCLWRTAYIVAAVVLNKWSIPVLRVVLAWGRNTGISSSSGYSLLSEEELAILFFRVVLDVGLIKYGRIVTEDILCKSRSLLMENHFQTCKLDVCTHIDTIRSVTGGSISPKECEELLGKCDLSARTSRPEEEEIRCGQSILEFFRFYGMSQGSALKKVLVQVGVNCQLCLLNLKDLEYIQIGEQMMQAYHSLANCSNIDDFLHPSCGERRRLTMVMPNEVSSLFKYVEAGWEDNLKQDTGVSVVNIRKKTFKVYKPGHVIEAWGNAEAIRRLKARIHRIVSSAACFIEGNLPQDRWCISGAYRTVVEGAPGPESMFEVCPYNGRCQDWHNKRMKQIPVLKDRDPSDVYSTREVISCFEEQRLFLKKNYNFNVHGGIRVAVSFGNLYMIGFSLGPMIVGDLSRILAGRPSGEKAEHVRSVQSVANSRPDYRGGPSMRSGLCLRGNFRPRRGNSSRNYPRARGAYSNNRVLHRPSNTSHSQGLSKGKSNSFIPIGHLNVERFMDFLKRNNFVETGHRVEYRSTVKMDVSDGLIVLNKDLRLTMFHLQDIKWFVQNVSRDRTDIRIKIHSRPIISAEALAKRHGCEDLLENAHNLLHRNSAGEVDGIALDEYKNRIRFMRYKDMTSFRFRGHTGSRRADDQDNFLNRITFKLNRGKEYRIPKDGIFTQVTDQTELILETELPDLEDKAECEEFMREIYEFSKGFAHDVVDNQPLM